ncbi:MAG TPA: hypothetical protein VGI90_04830 [Steroidobacteraceae bacterium]
MNEVCDIWSSPWRALHRRSAGSMPTAVVRTAGPGTGSWLGRARLAAALKKARPASTPAS